MSRRHNVRLLHSHVTYTAQELAIVLDVCIGTVRRWVKLGLAPIDQHSPRLFLGRHAAHFLAARAQPRQSLAPGELYCVACKVPRGPFQGVIKLVPRSTTTVDFNAFCPACSRELFRRVRIAEIGEKIGSARIADEDGAIPISSARQPHQMSLFEDVER